MVRFFSFLLISLLPAASLHGQLKNFATPLKIPIALSANFGELRPDHFHTGLDFKTEQRTGIPIHASADGYISRVVVSPTGYGKALYINHPNNTTTLYGHLLKFSDEVEAWVKEEQYRMKSFAVDLSPPSGKFTVSRDEPIALSGNSGSSGGPHLHFEIRDSYSQDALNPLTIDSFGARDNTPPRITGIKFYPLDGQSHVEFKNNPQKFIPVASGSEYRLNPARAVNAGGRIGIAVKANDYFDDSHNPCGIRKAELILEGTVIHSFTIDRISFSLNRYHNSHIDYEEYARNKEYFHKLWLDPGNKLPFYTTNEARGVMTIESGKVYKGEIILTDVAGNKARFSFSLSGAEWTTPEMSREKSQEIEKPFFWKEANRFSAPGFELSTPAEAFYDDFNFRYQQLPSGSDFQAPLHQVHSRLTPIHKSLKIRIKPTNLPDSLHSRAFIALVNEKGNKRYAGGRWSQGWMESDIREFGNYTVAIDTIAPKIVPLSIKNNSLTESSWIRFTISDDFSGIKKYNGFIDGQWALFEYDPKTRRLSYRIDTNRIGTGRRHSVNLIVTDNAGNSSVYSATFWK